MMVIHRMIWFLKRKSGRKHSKSASAQKILITKILNCLIKLNNMIVQYYTKHNCINILVPWPSKL